MFDRQCVQDAQQRLAELGEEETVQHCRGGPFAEQSAGAAVERGRPAPSTELSAWGWLDSGQLCKQFPRSGGRRNGRDPGQLWRVIAKSSRTL